MRAFICVIALMFVFQPLSADAQDKKASYVFVDGNELHDMCNSGKDSPNYLWCNMYVAGALDDISIEQGMNYGNLPVCAPGGLTVAQGVDLVRKYMDDNPEQRHEPAALIVRLAMTFYYPCPIWMWEAVTPPPNKN